MRRETELIAAEILAAKAELSKAKKALADLETEIAGQLTSPDNGSKTHNVGEFKIVVKRGENITADMVGIMASGAQFKPMAVKNVFDRKGLEWIKENAPDDFALVREFITTKPAKTSVTVTKVEG